MSESQDSQANSMGIIVWVRSSQSRHWNVDDKCVNKVPYIRPFVVIHSPKQGQKMKWRYGDDLSILLNFEEFRIGLLFIKYLSFSKICLKSILEDFQIVFHICCFVFLTLIYV